MSKLDELREHVAKLFDAATDKTTIEKCAVVKKTIDEIEAEQKKANDDYQSLLKDYKDVVVHSSYKPSSQVEAKTGEPKSFDSNATFNDIFLKDK